MTHGDEQLVSFAEACELLGMVADADSRSWLERAIPPLDFIGRRAWWTRERIIAWVQQQARMLEEAAR